MAEHANSTGAPAAEQSTAFHLKLDDLTRLRGDQLMAVYDALMAARYAALGVANQPRCGRENRLPGGELITELVEWFDGAVEMVITAADAREPQDKDDSEYCAWISVKHQANMMDDLDDLTALAGHRSFEHRRRRFGPEREVR